MVHPDILSEENIRAFQHTAPDSILKFSEQLQLADLQRLVPQVPPYVGLHFSRFLSPSVLQRDVPRLIQKQGQMLYFGFNVPAKLLTSSPQQLADTGVVYPQGSMKTSDKSSLVRALRSSQTLYVADQTRDLRTVFRAAKAPIRIKVAPNLETAQLKNICQDLKDFGHVLVLDASFLRHYCIQTHPFFKSKQHFFLAADVPATDLDVLVKHLPYGCILTIDPNMHEVLVKRVVQHLSENIVLDIRQHVAHVVCHLKPGSRFRVTAQTPLLSLRELPSHCTWYMDSSLDRACRHELAKCVKRNQTLELVDKSLIQPDFLRTFSKASHGIKLQYMPSNDALKIIFNHISDHGFLSLGARYFQSMMQKWAGWIKLRGSNPIAEIVLPFRANYHDLACVITYPSWKIFRIDHQWVGNIETLRLMLKDMSAGQSLRLSTMAPTYLLNQVFAHLKQGCGVIFDLGYKVSDRIRGIASSYGFDEHKDPDHPHRYIFRAMQPTPPQRTIASLSDGDVKMPYPQGQPAMSVQQTMLSRSQEAKVGADTIPSGSLGLKRPRSYQAVGAVVYGNTSSVRKRPRSAGLNGKRVDPRPTDPRDPRPTDPRVRSKTVRWGANMIRIFDRNTPLPQSHRTHAHATIT